MAEHHATGSVVKLETAATDLTVNELLLAFSNHAESYYRRSDGSAAPELDNLRIAIRPLRQLYGHAMVKDFDPRALKAIRQSMLEAGLGRRTINQRVARLIRVFRFAVENEMIGGGIVHALEAVESLKKGKSGAREPKKVKPVSDERPSFDGAGALETSMEQRVRFHDKQTLLVKVADPFRIVRQNRA